MPSATGPTQVQSSSAEEFDLYAFWIQHKQKILLFVVLLVVALVGYGGFEISRQKAELAAGTAFSAAKTEDDLRKVIAEHSGSVAAANAQLLLADKLRAAQKYDESNTVLNEFISKNPKHPLLSGAYTSQAANFEATEKLDQALALYQKVAAEYPTSFSAPVAMISQARILKSQGKIDDARKTYDAIVEKYPDNPITRQAFGESMQLPRPKPEPAAAENADSPAGANPAPAAEATPASPAAATPAVPSVAPAPEAPKESPTGSTPPEPPRSETPGEKKP